MDIELDYMMAKGSNSGIYLQGRYEIQLLDSWSVVSSRSGDNGSKKSPSTLTFAGIKPLLTRYACVSCHSPEKKLVGPSFTDVARRGYSVDKIVQLLYNPQPKNWPGYAVAMPPMTQVTSAYAKQIAAWIKTLKK